MVKIIQLTDLHIGRQGEDTRGVDVRANFLACLEAVIRESPDVLILSGDLCFHQGDAEVYSWIRSQLETVPFPVLPIAGNHDDSALLARHFKLDHLLRDGELYYHRKLPGADLLLLDSSRGSLGEKQWDWLESKLDKFPDSRVLLFMHHPPVQAGVPFMDSRYAFQQEDRFRVLTDRLEYSLPVFCGHYHVDKVLSEPRFRLFLSPSTFFQIHPDEPGFAVDHYHPAYRRIQMDGRVLHTCVRYLRPSS